MKVSSFLVFNLITLQNGGEISTYISLIIKWEKAKSRSNFYLNIILLPRCFLGMGVSKLMLSLELLTNLINSLSPPPALFPKDE